MQPHYFSIHIIMMAALGFVSSQSTNLGIFNVPFKIVLTNQDQREITTAATTAATTVSSASSASYMTSDMTASMTSAMTSSAAATTITQAPTTMAPPYVPSVNVSIQLHLKLADVFSKTTAYLSMTNPNLIKSNSTMLTYAYDVIYNKTRLNELELLQPDSKFIEELRNATSEILNWKMNFTDWFMVHVKETDLEMDKTINAVNVQFSDTVWRCTGSACSDPSTICAIDGNTVACLPKETDPCVEFEKKNNCTDDPSVAGVYLRGTCKVDEDDNAYCDCGMSSGDIMHNFFDGRQCVSVTFIVAMAACAGGFFFLLLLLALCALCRRKESRHSLSRESSRHVYTTYNGYNESHAGVEMNQRHSKDHGSPKDRRRSSLSLGINNNAYDVTKEGNVEFKSIRL